MTHIHSTQSLVTVQTPYINKDWKETKNFPTTFQTDESGYLISDETKHIPTTSTAHSLSFFSFYFSPSYLIATKLLTTMSSSLPPPLPLLTAEKIGKKWENFFWVFLHNDNVVSVTCAIFTIFMGPHFTHSIVNRFSCCISPLCLPRNYLCVSVCGREKGRKRMKKKLSGSSRGREYQFLWRSPAIEHTDYWCLFRTNSNLKMKKLFPLEFVVVAACKRIHTISVT